MALELRQDNPYSRGTITIFPEGDAALDGPSLIYNLTPRDRIVKTQEGNDFSDIAYDQLDNSKYWWLPWMLSDVDFPFELENLPGTEILIPDVDYFKMINP